MSNLAKKTVDKLASTQEALGAHTGFIGAMTYYEVGSSASISHDRLEDLFCQFGLPSTYLPGLPSPQKVFAYCVKRGNVGVSDAQVIRISRESSHDIWGIYPINVTGDGAIMDREAELGEPLAKLGFFPDDPSNSGQPLLVASENGSITKTPSNPVAATIISEYKRRCNLHTTPDISEMIRTTLKRFGRIRMKRGGHLYFVPAGRMDDLSALRDVVAEIGDGDTCVAIIPAAEHPDGIAEITTEARKGFEEEIKILRDKVSEFGGSTRESTKERTVEEVLELKAQLELYRDISAGLVESLRSDADTLMDEVRSMMGVE